MLSPPRPRFSDRVKARLTIAALSAAFSLA